MDNDAAVQCDSCPRSHVRMAAVVNTAATAIWIPVLTSGFVAETSRLANTVAQAAETTPASAAETPHARVRHALKEKDGHSPKSDDNAEQCAAGNGLAGQDRTPDRYHQRERGKQQSGQRGVDVLLGPEHCPVRNGHHGDPEYHLIAPLARRTRESQFHCRAGDAQDCGRQHEADCGCPKRRHIMHQAPYGDPGATP
jgi:hypothetical protein